MNVPLAAIISDFTQHLTEERKAILQPLVDYIQTQKNKGQTIRLTFICTHNSRRSHLAQIWAQTMAYHFGIKDVFCYSGGTETTALFPKVVETLSKHGFEIQTLSEGNNPIYAVKYAENEAPIVGFSKPYFHDFNPKHHFAAVMTCSHADEGCPLVIGAEARFPVRYDDPKAFDGTAMQTQKYKERSLEIAQEMWYVMGRIK